MDMCTGAKHLWINTQFWETNTQFFPPARADSSSRLNRSCAVCRASGEKGVSTNGDPKNGWLLLENPMKVDDLEVPPFQETSLNGSLEMTESCHVRAGNTRYINHHLICFKLMPSSCWICCPPVSKKRKTCITHTHSDYSWHPRLTYMFPLSRINLAGKGHKGFLSHGGIPKIIHLSRIVHSKTNYFGPIYGNLHIPVPLWWFLVD